MDPIRAYHHSQKSAFRAPFGAIPVGETLRLSLLVDTAGVFDAQVFLRIWGEDESANPAPPQLLPMSPSPAAETPNFHAGDHLLNWPGQAPPPLDAVLYSTAYTAPETPGLLWYDFVIRSGEQQSVYALPAGTGGEGQLNPPNPQPYQITVYTPVEIPVWYRHGIAYQIFPDRFHRGADWLQRAVEARAAQSTRGIKRVLQLDWDDTSYYQKDAAGRVTRWPFFGGTLLGIAEKLPYLADLGVTTLYLNPIFLAASNHKYDTGDYMRIDPGFGDEDGFQSLCQQAAALGIAIILDGVFNHTGCNSLYFNKYGDYPAPGAFQSTESLYRDWYRFETQPGKYDCWWGVDDLPNVNELHPGYQDYIWRGEDSVIRHWIRAGARGWRLDVVDELPREFVEGLRSAAKAEDTGAVLIGEVWEDASNKISYGVRRRYFLGSELDATMNYPFRIALIDFLLGKIGPGELHRQLMQLLENYPPQHFYAQLNLIGSHDRSRILTVLGEGEGQNVPEDEKEHFRLSTEKRRLAVRRLKLLSLLQMVFPGVPCVYYGDEAGAEGFADPYNRGTYPWGAEDRELLGWYRWATGLRRQYPLLLDGDFRSFGGGKHVYGFSRSQGGEQIMLLLNPHSSESETIQIHLEVGQNLLLDLRTGENPQVFETPPESPLSVEVPPLDCRLLYAKAIEAPAYKPAAGILCHITSLPGGWPGAPGDFGKGARAFVDFLALAGQTLWQVLPLNPTGMGDSPFSSSSLFAGSAGFLDMEQLVEEGLLSAEELAAAQESKDILSLEQAASAKLALLQKALPRFATKKNADYAAFLKENQHWLPDYALFRTLQDAHGTRPWQRWEAGLRQRKPGTLARWRKKLAAEVELHLLAQYLFARQWQALHDYANRKGVRIVGDLPFYPAGDSCDVWANQTSFLLDAEGNPAATGGVPPDYFAQDGQNWNTPVYNWQALEHSGYDFWMRRVKQGLSRFDFLRIDHFRGLDAYFEIPAGAKTAAAGSWKKGPGHKLLRALAAIPGFYRLIAEDLGTLTPEVHLLKDSYLLPGMQVFQFSGEKMLQPGRVHLSLYYTGTHDNDTLAGFSTAEKGLSGEELRRKCKETVEALYASKGLFVMVALQDVFCLDSAHRMNVPGVAQGNWGWRLPKDLPLEEAAAWLRELAEKYGR